VVGGAGVAAAVADVVFREAEFGRLRFAIAHGAAVAFIAAKLSDIRSLSNRRFREDCIFNRERDFHANVIRLHCNFGFRDPRRVF